MIPLLAIIVIAVLALWVFVWTIHRLFFGDNTAEEGRRVRRKWQNWLDE